MVETITRYKTSDGKVFNDIDEAYEHEQKSWTPARTLRFYGYGDDGIAVDNCYSDESGDESFFESPLVVMNHEQDEGLLVHANYVSPGVWMVGMSPIGEYFSMPPWPIFFDFEYSTAVLEIKVPAGTTVKKAPRRLGGV